MSEFRLDVETAADLKDGFRRHGWTNEQINLLKSRNHLRDFRRVLEGTHKVVPVEMFVRVDRTKPPQYMNLFPEARFGDVEVEVLEPDLENHGPNEIVLSDVIFSKAPFGISERLDHSAGKDLYNSLKATGTIGQCLSLRDGEEIAKRPWLWPLEWNERNVTDRSLCLWKSVIRVKGGSLNGYTLVPDLSFNPMRQVVSIGCARIDNIYMGQGYIPMLPMGTV
jgi:hypothetical protein